ncbi:phosphatidate cytidylyltransferase [Synechococcales cyanobacterium C]|uniref:Phosphatidate cytidylyltransferase n=1 Tax=Petrachloros mirabilis ULC683 TaxID=2781853 RepID=A0A8K2A674_9CYAN|nr:phosphatidate cytidylyltransferase [Petrachloros mirabilis]NCJ04940.1 phosphatidate cytidylyltransferase [Petrachloros mirabilis ULC683]
MTWTLPAPNVFWALGVIFLLLFVTTFLIYAVAFKNPDKNYTELKLRIKSWWVIVVLFAIALTLSRTSALVFFAFLSFLALKEYLSLIPTRRADRRVLFWAYLAVIIQYYWIAINWYVMFLIFVPVYMFLFLPMRMVILGETQGFLKAIGALHWGMMLTVFSLGHIAYLLMLPFSGNPVAGGAGLLLYLVFLTEINDIAQYIWGKSCGRHKVLPQVSPNKTWEGLLGGILTTTLMAVLLAPWLTPFQPLHALAIGLLISWAGFIGDVTISALKRDLGVKDSGNLIPGHGGILDRIDSLTYTAPLFFHFTVYFYFQGVLT